MEVQAKLSHLRIAPRKVRLTADLIRGISVDKALTILNFTNTKTAKPLKKLLNSAVANAKHNSGLEQSNLYISEIFIDEGRKYKRWLPRSRGRADEIIKRTSHINLTLKEKVSKKKIKKTEKVKKEKTIKKKDK